MFDIIKQIGGGEDIILIMSSLFVSLSIVLIISYIYYLYITCTDVSSCTHFATFDDWAVNSDNSMNVILKKNCKNKYTEIDVCKKLNTNITSKSINVSNWSGRIDKDLSGSITRTCNDISFCPLILTSKQLSTDKLIKYPPDSLTKIDLSSANISTQSDSTYYVGYSSYYTNTEPINILLNSPNTRGTNAMFFSDEKYDQTTGLPVTGVSSINGISGEWVSIKLPTQIMVKVYRIYPRSQGDLFDRRSPKEFIIFGSNDGNNWIIIDDRRGTRAPSNWGNEPMSFYVDNRTKYDRYLLLATLIGNSDKDSNRNSLNLEKLELFEERNN